MPLAIPFVLLLAAVFLMALSMSQNAAMRPYWDALGKAIGSLLPGGFLGDLVGRFTRKIISEAAGAITHAAGATLGALADFINAYAALKREISRATYTAVYDIVTTMEYWAAHAIPHAIGGAVAAPWNLAEQARKAADRAIQAARRAEKTAAKAIGAAAAIPQLRRRIGTVSRTLDRLRDLARGIDRRARSLARRITRVEKLTAVAALTAVVVRVLARRLPWLFCRRVDRVARTVCGVDTDFLNSVLSTALVVASVVELRAMARALEEPTRLTMEGVERFVRELD